jgi:cytochrome c oxidase subunit 2
VLGELVRSACLLCLLGSFVACGGSDEVTEEAAGTRPAGLDEAAWGERVFVGHGCVACHRLDAEPLVGPGLGALAGSRVLLDGRSVPADADYLRRALVDPNAEIVRGYSPVMPSYAYLSEPDLAALTAYLRTIQPPP